MRMGPIMLLVATAAFAGWAAPGLRVAPKTPAVGAARTDLAVHAIPPQQSHGETWFSGATVLDRMGDGHFYTDADIGSRSVRFLVDTGASVVALTGPDARAAGLDWSDADLRAIGRGASGTVYGVPVRLEKIELNGFEARDVPAAIIPEGLDVSLLGQSFLSRLRGVRIDGDRMILNDDD